MNQPLVMCVVLNFGRLAETLTCLASLTASTYARRQIMVLDYASTEGSAAALAHACPEARILPLARNLGYAGNNNLGIRAALEAGADWVFILNEDTGLAPNWAAEPAALGQSDPRIGMAGSLVYHHDEPTVIPSAGGRLGPLWTPTLIGLTEPECGQYREARAVDWLAGCALFVRRKLIEEIGMFDERLFMYWEETDRCVRARAAGWRLAPAPAAKLWHKGVRRDYEPSPRAT